MDGVIAAAEHGGFPEDARHLEYFSVPELPDYENHDFTLRLARSAREFLVPADKSATDVLAENGVHIETGPHKHAIQGTFFLYVWEPAGNRVELANAGARLILAPDWETVTWTEAERKRGQAWGLKTIETFHTHGTPPVPAE